ncbi:hypothetical protein EOD29_32465, partial [Mesorhizobium sp. M1A.T.Ca.IN.004.03.1.1]
GQCLYEPENPSLDVQHRLASWRADEAACGIPSAPKGIIETLARRGNDRRLALVSHADVIKAAVSHVLGLPIDAWPRFDIAPASVTTV